MDMIYEFEDIVRAAMRAAYTQGTGERLTEDSEEFAVLTTSRVGRGGVVGVTRQRFADMCLREVARLMQARLLEAHNDNS